MATFVHFKRFFGHELDILAYIELQIAQNMLFHVQIECCWFHSKILIFGQVMAKKWRACPYLGIGFWPVGLQFFMGVQETIILVAMLNF